MAHMMDIVNKTYEKNGNEIGKFEILLHLATMEIRTKKKKKTTHRKQFEDGEISYFKSAAFTIQ